MAKTIWDFFTAEMLAGIQLSQNLIWVKENFSSDSILNWLQLNYFSHQPSRVRNELNSEVHSSLWHLLLRK